MVEHSSDKRKVPGPIPGARTMPIYFSKTGLEKKKKEITVKENQIKEFQKEAADAAGVSYDWHDNFGAEEATRQAESATTELLKLKDELKNAVVIEPKEQNEVAQIGTTISFLLDGKESEFTIGASGETDPAKGLISYASPLASQLLEMKIGESKNITMGNTKKELKITKIFPPSYKYMGLVMGR